MLIEKVVTGCLQENCYIIKNLENECLIVDPGYNFEDIKKQIGSYKVLKILLTHSHFDHVGALKQVEEEYSVTTLKKDNSEEKEYHFGHFHFNVIFTPGHSSDSISFYFFEDDVMFTGDFLFKGTIGRVDLPTGDMGMMKSSLMKISKYDSKIKIYPGHGDVSTLGEEFQNNDYFEIV